MADNWLGVPKLLTPEEIVNPNVDELSMMTYLAQFREAKVKEGAPIQTENKLNGLGFELVEPLLSKDAADDQKPSDAGVTKQLDESQRNIGCEDKLTFNSSSLFASLEKDGTASSFDNLPEEGRRSCCTYFLVVLIAVIVAFISTRQYDL